MGRCCVCLEEVLGEVVMRREGEWVRRKGIFPEDAF